jgi:riboflavin biosynthesis pyrimidine reductase
MTVLRLLLPGNADVGDLDEDRDATLQAVADLYAYPDPMPSRGWVRSSMVSTLDGSATGPEGLSGSIGGPADTAIFGVLRALADVIMVGAGTVRSEGYGLPTVDDQFADRRLAAGQCPAPALAIVTGSGDVPAGVLFSGPNPSYVITTARADLGRLRSLTGPDRVIVAGDQDVDLEDAVKALARRRLGRILLEGGPSLLGSMLAAARVDELCLTLAPQLLAGAGPRIATGAPAWLAARPAHLIAAGDVLLSRWLVHPPDPDA